MKRLWVFVFIAAFALVGWAMPAGAEKVRLTEDEMDNVAAGGCVNCLVDQHIGGGIGPVGGGFTFQVLCDDGKAVNLKGGGHVDFGDMLGAVGPLSQLNGGGLGGGGFLSVTPSNKPADIVQFGGSLHLMQVW